MPRAEQPRAAARRVGLVVNPVAGLGGRAALKGSDDPELVALARERGAEEVSPARAEQALELLAAGGELELLVAPGEMGEREARARGFQPVVVGEIGAATTAADTRAAAAAMAAAGVELLLFAGGDGTAVDVLEAVGDRVPALGIPAGEKMHSAVFAVNPRSAGELALRFLRGGGEVEEGEVMDVDESALREGVVSARLHGYLRVPASASRVQGGKARSAPSERAAQAALGRYVAEAVLGDGLVLVGPGTTTRAILAALGLEKALLGVDAIRAGRLVAADADERALLELADPDTKVVVTPVGGQGFVFGRGNQQLSARVLRSCGPGNVVVVATEAKLAGLSGRPLLVDTGDPALDAGLSGFRRVITGPGREVVYRVAC